MSDNASRFVHAFNQIEQHLRGVTRKDANCRFHDEAYDFASGEINML
jgi:hypothetical protein